MPEKKSRIEFIDLAKGFCILIVVFFHISRALEVSYPLDELTSKIRMPLYYILSGLFFKEYENFGGFLKRKTNKLIIPFLFAYICISSPYMFYKDYSLGLPLSSIANHILLGVYHKNFINMVIWFLLSLFITSIFFYLIVIVSKRFGERKVMMLILLSLAIGFVGVLLAYSRTRLPLYLDTSLTATPLYSLGYILNKHSNILRKSKIDRYLLLIIPLMFLGAYLVEGRCNFATNHYWTHPLLLYPSCMLAALAVILLAKLIKHIPWVTYVGRYSVILLLFHEPVFYLVIKVLGHFHIGGGYSFVLLTFAITCVILTGLIPICRKYLPYVTAQKDLIKV